MPESHLPLRNLEDRHSQKQPRVWPEFTAQNALIVILMLVLIVAGVYIFKPGLFKSLAVKSTKSEQKQEARPEIKSSGYSAVFLTNNQVYFGRLSEANSAYPKLTEVYYLRIERALQPPPATESAQPDVQLVKLGNELHGPIDEIKFNREQILYIEDLKGDSRIVVAIKEFKNKK